MSAIWGISTHDGEAVSAETLRQMAKPLEQYAPDGTAFWHEGAVGLGFAAFHTFPQVAQPYCFDGNYWIVADARIDEQTNLIKKLLQGGVAQASELNEPGLIAAAYHLWGVDCLKHLIGDFAFAIWDKRQNCLFCARDHFAVKPFYYAYSNKQFAFASGLDAVLKAFPASQALDESWIGDFLCLGYAYDKASTVYQAIRRLPAAHWLKLSPDGMQIQKYWDLSQVKGEYFPSSGDYLNRYRELFTLAVRDRLRSEKVAVSMSGGTDSTAVAAIATKFTKLKAVVQDSRQIIQEDEEAYYAQMVSDYCHFPLERHLTKHFPIFENPASNVGVKPQPVDLPDYEEWQDYMRICLAQSRVVLTGYGGDAIFAQNNYYLRLLRSGKFLSLLRALYHYQRQHGSLVRSNIRGQILALLGKKIKPDWFPEIPNWVSDDFVRRSGMRERFATYEQETTKMIWQEGLAYAKTESALWAWIFEDNAVNYQAELRHPFFDKRLVDFVLNLPPEYKKQKMLHRKAMEGYLPSAVLERPKTPLVSDPYIKTFLLPENQSRLLSDLPHASVYIDVARYHASIKEFIANCHANITKTACSTAPIGLELWLEYH